MNYCTYLTIYHGNKLPPFYIGFSTIKKVFNGYHGTVCSKRYKSIWDKEQEVNPQFFTTRILTTHQDRNEALLKEQEFQRALNVIKNPLYTNQTIRGHCDTTGIKLTDDHKHKIAMGCKGKNRYIKTQEHRQKISMTMTGRKRGPYKKRQMYSGPS